MQFNVAQLLKEPTGSTRRHDIDEVVYDLDPELVIQEPITGKVKFTKIPRGVLVTGELETVVEMNCNRCLEAHDQSVTFELEEEFYPLVDLQTGASLPQSDEMDEATLIDEKNLIDLSEVTRQNLLLSLPSLPVCKEDCKGICPQCGQNLNEASCDCPTESIDPRWEALRALLDEPTDAGASESATE